MAVDLALALVFVTQGGQISVMITEFFQGMFCGFALIIVGFLLYQFPWSTIVEALRMTPPDASRLNPYHSIAAKDFNLWYFLIEIVMGIYNSMSWQGSSGFQSEAKSPHEARMGGIIGGWRGMPLACMVIMLSLAAFAVMTFTYSGIRQTINHVHWREFRTLHPRADDRAGGDRVTCFQTGIKGLMMTAMLFFSFYLPRHVHALVGAASSSRTCTCRSVKRRCISSQPKAYRGIIR